MLESTKEMSIYFCGGTGVNCYLQGNYTMPTTVSGFATMKPYVIDDKPNNIDASLVGDNMFFLGKGGAGKVRDTHLPEWRAALPKILLNFVPGDFNIVVCSTGGGTGSLVAPLLVNRLLTEGHNVVMILLGSDDCTQDLKNTSNTLKGIYAAVNGIKKDLVVSFIPTTQSFTETNAAAISTIDMIGILASDLNQGMDYQDIESLLNPSRFHGGDPSVCLLKMTIDSPELIDTESLATAVSLYRNRDKRIQLKHAEFEKIAQLTEGNFNPENNWKSVFYSVHNTGFEEHVQHYSEAYDKYLKVQAAKTSANKPSKINVHTSDDDFLVL